MITTLERPKLRQEAPTIQELLPLAELMIVGTVSDSETKLRREEAIDMVTFAVSRGLTIENYFLSDPDIALAYTTGMNNRQSNIGS